MIIHLKNTISIADAQSLAVKYQAVLIESNPLVLVTTSKLKQADEELQHVASEIFVTDTDIQLAGK